MLRLVGLHERPAPAGRRRPARPTTWQSSCQVRSAARSSGRLRAMSALTTPTSVTSGTSRPLATRLVPTSTSERPLAEVIDDPGGGAPALDDVAVEPRHAQVGESDAQLLLDALGAASQVADAHRAAGRTASRDGCRGATVVAAQGHDRGMEDERPLALRADLHVAAVAAEHDAGGAAAVDEQDGAVPDVPVERHEGGGQRRRDEAAVALGQLDPHVHGLDRHGRPGAAAFQPKVPEPTLPREAHADDVGGRRAEDDRGGGEPAQDDGHVASLVAGRAVRLVGRVVLLVHDDDAQGLGRRQDGHARAHHDARLASAMRRHSSLRSPSPRALWRSAMSSSRSWRRRSMSGVASGDLGHQHERTEPTRERRHDGLGVDGGLAAGGLALQQEGLVAARRQGRLHGGERGRLSRLQVAARGTAAPGTGGHGRRAPAAGPCGPPGAAARAARGSSRCPRRDAPPSRAAASSPGSPVAASSARSACWRTPSGGPAGRSPAASAVAAARPSWLRTAQRSWRGRAVAARTRHSSRSSPLDSSWRSRRRSVARLGSLGRSSTASPPSPAACTIPPGGPPQPERGGPRGTGGAEPRAPQRAARGHGGRQRGGGPAVGAAAETAGAAAGTSDVATA